MSVDGIKINQIHKAKSGKILVFCNLYTLLHPVNRRVGMFCFRDSFIHENIRNFPNGNHGISGILQSIQHRILWRLYGKIVPIGRTFKLSFFCSDIRSGNYPSHLPRRLHADISCNFTATVEFLQTKKLLILRRGNLEYRVRGRIDNHRSASELFFAEFIQYSGSRRGLISDNFMSRSLLQFLNKFFRKTGIRKCHKGNFGLDSHHLPMSGHRILPVTRFIQTKKLSARFGNGVHAFQLF